MKLFSHLIFLLLALSVYPQTAVVISENANLRGTPTEKGSVVETLKRDTKVEIIKQKSTWFLVQSTEYVGWLHGNTIRLSGTRETVRSAGTIPESTFTPRQTTDLPAPVRFLSKPRSLPTPLSGSSPSRQYFRGPRGGCYYINSSGKKTYVDHSFCS